MARDEFLRRVDAQVEALGQSPTLRCFDVRTYQESAMYSMTEVEEASARALRLATSSIDWSKYAPPSHHFPQRTPMVGVDYASGPDVTVRSVTMCEDEYARLTERLATLEADKAALIAEVAELVRRECVAKHTVMRVDVAGLVGPDEHPAARNLTAMAPMTRTGR